MINEEYDRYYPYTRILALYYCICLYGRMHGLVLTRLSYVEWTHTRAACLRAYFKMYDEYTTYVYITIYMGIERLVRLAVGLGIYADYTWYTYECMYEL